VCFSRAKNEINFASDSSNVSLYLLKLTRAALVTLESMDLGLFTIKETTINHSSGNTSISRTPKVTGKGQIYFVNKFIANNPLRAGVAE
jgi:anti-repressor protein